MGSWAGRPATGCGSRAPSVCSLPPGGKSPDFVIGFMPVTTGERLSSGNFLSIATAWRIIEAATGSLIPVPGLRSNGPASYHQIPGRDQLIGFIGAMTNRRFPDSRNKLRLTSDGGTRPCPGSHPEFDLRSVLRSGATDDEIGAFSARW
ncbi:MAG: hypothetical protein EOP86_26650 [Verrucomicrobiaceae bacterium]|nr:MAG: hypothetical protein EOP86_26650 [Verrucomicrobiaceae bacterium]